jgi:AbrB family looped-hinge helix DNA binding protein
MNHAKAKVGERGQVTIPKRLRRSLGIRAGEEVEFEESQGTLLLRRAHGADPVDRLIGAVRESIDVDAYLAQARGRPWNAAQDAPRHGLPKRSSRSRHR